MPALNLTRNLSDPDGLYEALIRLHEGRSEEESLRISARLILILMNHVGDRKVVDAALAAARKD
ncbi:MAG: DUF2783 domain-containing protein [Fulvimarina manganoxydans]|uniref:DUF2783 domain-containing protein n=1 Tax=Fulvimarina manganoxydans TaxID=937218 RepID=UPI002354C349|nr:DUF2783 domain-containing protein [Fulvimarina manganoxydans]MCK5933835.1 DUF2783 domain-containing protein [Fulvimarina manganoxydans]